jgi:hypothetical protein
LHDQTIPLLPYLKGLRRCPNNILDEVEPKDQIIGKWQLFDLVNISDKQKYLNETLEIKEDYHYAYKEENETLISHGNWSYSENKEYIKLSNGRYEETEVSYRIIEKTSEFLKLEKHYTLDNKDTFLEYHYQKTE